MKSFTRSFIMTFGILFSFSCFADSFSTQPQDLSQLITFRQQITYVFLAREVLLRKQVITEASAIGVQAQAVWQFLHEQSSNYFFQGDKRALSADRVRAIVETFIQIEIFYSPSRNYVLEKAVDMHFLGEVAQIVLPKAMKSQDVAREARFIYDALAVQYIIPPHEPEFNLAKIQSLLTGQDSIYDAALAESAQFFEVRKCTSILSLEKKVSLVLDTVKRNFSSDITLAQIPAFAQGIKFLIIASHGVDVSSDIIQLILEARYLVGPQAPAHEVVRQLEVTFTHETQNERLVLGNTTTAQDVITRALDMHIIDHGITPEFSLNRISEILSPQASGDGTLGVNLVQVGDNVIQTASQRASEEAGIGRERLAAEQEAFEDLIDAEKEKSRANKNRRESARRFREDIHGRSGRSKRR